MALHEVLRKTRLERGMKQKDVAASIGVSEPTYSMYEKGTREPNAQKLRELAVTLGVSTDYLLGLSSSTNQNSDHLDFLSLFSEEELASLNTIFNDSFLIPPNLLLQILILYVNQDITVRVGVVERLLQNYSSEPSPHSSMPSPNVEQIQHAVDLIRSYLDYQEN